PIPAGQTRGSPLARGVPPVTQDGPHDRDFGWNNRIWPAMEAEEVPTLSVIMANHNGGAYLRAAIGSVLAQTLQDIEVIVADDCSADDSVVIARELASQDGRVRVLTAPANTGPGASRNRALDAARGDWVAVVDSDDLILPDRFRRMLDHAAGATADIVADNLSLFSDAGGADLGHLLPADIAQGLVAVTPDAFLRSELPGPGHAPLGYLKPLIRRDRIGEMRYREDLRVGEDHDFLLRLLLKGLSMTVMPDAFYRYRKREGSVSHRLKPADIRAMIAAQDRLAPAIGPSTELQRLFAQRRKNLCRELRFAELVGRIKGRDPLGALAIMLRDPPLVRNLARAAREHLARKDHSIAR
ncbi:MAG: glycosyltransferase family 2 protein, partial [Albidovulum sp.]|uniref:glycosyltransferase family 2 protein n=1 Tax=Albidovulum sp. TaxID=1872424 RepID=UPI003CBE55A8